MQFKGLGAPNKRFATQNKQMYLQHRRQPISQPETADRHHQPDTGRDTAPTGYRPCPHLWPPIGNVRSDLLHWGQLPEGERTGKAGTLKKFNRIDQKHFWRNPQDVLSSATRKWSCLLNNFHPIENNPTPSECSTPTLDEWSAFATFLADVIEKYASVLEIDNAVSSTNNENRQDTVDTALAAWYNILVIFVPTQWQDLPFHCITYTERGA